MCWSHKETLAKDGPKSSMKQTLAGLPNLYVKVEMVLLYDCEDQLSQQPKPLGNGTKNVYQTIEHPLTCNPVFNVEMLISIKWSETK